MKIIGMIPARMGSQRLKKKNLREINGIPLIVHAIRKCKEAKCFDEVWVNSEHDKFGDIARDEGVFFHKRPEELANNHATSEEFVYEFLCNHDCDYLFQVHSIAPLLTINEVQNFVNHQVSNLEIDVLLSVVHEQIECAYQNKPINFSFEEKMNSQRLIPIQKVTWSITGWRRDKYLNSYNNGKCATYNGKIEFYPISKFGGIIIKTESDFKMVCFLFNNMK